MVFANHSKEDVIYPFTVKEITLAQERDLVLKKLTKMEQYSTHLVEDTEVLWKDGKTVIPKVLERRAHWYHHYLQHPGHTCLEETLNAAMYWKGMQNTIQLHVKNSPKCQLKQHSTSMGTSLQSLSSQPLGKPCAWTSLDHTLSKEKIGQKLTLCA